MICGLLVLQEPELPLPLDTLSPWIDMVTCARKEVFADLAAQTHRRFIKTHTPLDRIPNDPTVTYIGVASVPLPDAGVVGAAVIGALWTAACPFHRPSQRPTLIPWRGAAGS
jgi:hypothetical protein